MSAHAHHAAWRRLLDVEGPFLTLPVLSRAFPQGLDDFGRTDRLRAAYDEWRESQAGRDRHGSGARDTGTHRLWLRFVLRELLGHDDETLREGQALSPAWSVRVSEHREELRPDVAVVNPPGTPGAGTARLLVQLLPRGTDLERPLPGSRWHESPAGRLAILLRATDIRLGLLTDGERWMLVDAPRDGATGFTSWYADLWLEEKTTLRAFVTLLGPARFFGARDLTLEALLAESAVVEQEVTDQLGRQVRRAVEILVASLDRIDRVDRRGDVSLLADVSNAELYEAAVAVMMRLVFLFSAEERGLLPLDEELYGGAYAAGTLGEQLREAAERHGEEVLERRTDAWQRLLSLFRLVHGGARHQDLRLPPYGGRLFDPDRFPFLEGRAKGTSWRARAARPLPIDNRMVLHLLEALQLVRDRKSGAALHVSFRSLDVEQIGHVYEGLLDHTVRAADDVVLSLTGKEADEPELTLAGLEAARRKGDDALARAVAEATGRSEAAVRKALAQPLEPPDEHRLRVAVAHDAALLERLRPFAPLVRTDAFERPVVILPGSRYMTQGSDRRQTGTHYTPRSLTEPIVRHALEPLVYDGPAVGRPPSGWTLRSARQILSLKVCDMACGSGAFLVAACRYLASRLVEAWREAEAANPGRLVVTPEGDLAEGRLGESLVPRDDAERTVYALRLVAGRSLYGVDVNELAAEMARLSLWLVTLDRGKPFTFLDHAVKRGDSLLGVTSLAQLEAFSLDLARPRSDLLFLGDACRRALDAMARTRAEIEASPSLDIRDVERKESLLREIETARLAAVRGLGDLLVTLRLAELAGVTANRTEAEEALARCFEPGLGGEELERRVERLDAVYRTLLAALPRGAERRPFHWPVEFPEVFAAGSEGERGFDAFVGNPPFQGGQRITGALGTDYRDYLVEDLAGGRRGSADLCAYFFLRAARLLKDGGMAGLLATNTIAQGDTREVGLDALLAEGVTIPRAVPSRKWPGEASLEVAHVWLRKGAWGGPSVLDDGEVRGIGPMLTVPGRAVGKPFRLAANAGKSFQGSIVLGMGFVLTPEEAAALIARDATNRDVLFPYLGGEDVNGRPDQGASRWVINFHDWPLARATAADSSGGRVAADYPDCLAIAEERVRPERQRKNPNGAFALRKPLPERWWQYGEKRPSLYKAMATLRHAIVIVLHSHAYAPARVPTSLVFSHALAVITDESLGTFAVLASALHEGWARENGSTLETRFRYTATDCFETFPFPTSLAPLDPIGEAYDAHRRALMLARQEGLTRTYNRFHDTRESADDIRRLRELHVAMDQAVAAAYGWSDLDLGHGFRETKQGLRYTLSEPARLEILDRLLELNHARHAEEVRHGLHDGKGGKRKRKAAQGGLFEE